MATTNHLFSANRNSTPESSSLRPPGSRTGMPAGHQVRSSVGEMGSFSGAAPASRFNRPASEVIRGPNRESQVDAMDTAARQWIDDIDQSEAMLDEMAAAALDHEFKDELSAIEQWFKVLSEAERTAALYALLGNSTQVQVRFFSGVLQQMSKAHPPAVPLSPVGHHERESVPSRLSGIGKVGDRNSLAVNRNSQVSGTKRNSGLDQGEIERMFPMATLAIAQQRAEFEQQTGTAPATARNSVAGDRSSLAAPTISAPRDDVKKDQYGPTSPSPWSRQRNTDSQSSIDRPKSSSGQQPMGQFSQPPPSAGLRSPRNFGSQSEGNVQTTDNTLQGLPMFSPYQAGTGWASMMATPMVPNFGMQQGVNMGDVAAATQSKLSAMSTINNRMQLDAAPKYRRAHSTEGDRSMQSQAFGMGGVMRDMNGAILTPEQAAMVQQQQLMALGGPRSPTGSPARGPPGGMMPGMNFPPQNNAYLSVFGSHPAGLNPAMAGMNLGGYGGGGDVGYLSDASGAERGRSPRGRRGTSKPPDDPTDPELLKDVPAWLRTLRLHKYTDNLKDMKWQDIVQLDEDGLEKKGVNAKGARTKMLKIFEQVRENQASGKAS